MEPDINNPLPEHVQLPTELSLPKLLNLPIEIHQEIARHFTPTDFPSKQCLRMTCRLLRNHIATDTTQDLRELEKSAECIARGFIACTVCLRLRHESKFADKMRNIKRSDGTRTEFRQAKKRFCIDCGLASKLYTPGCYLQIEGVGYTMCIKDRDKEDLQMSAYESTEPGDCRELKMLRKRYCRKCWLSIRRDVMSILADEEREAERGIRDECALWGEDFMGLLFAVTPRPVRRDLFFCKLREDFRKGHDEGTGVL